MAVNLSPYGGVGAQFFSNNGVPLAGGKIFTYAAGTTTPQATYTSASGSTAHANPIILDAAGRVPGGEIWLTDGLQYKFVLKDANDITLATYDNVVGINSNFINYTNAQEIQTATAGQTVFTLTTMQYQPGTGSLSVFVDGVNQYGPGAQYAYVETDSTTVTFVTGLHVGASVKFTTAAINAASYGDAFQISYTPPFTASVATNVGDRLAQYISVKDFGAVGDGVVDDTAAIQAAIDYAQTIKAWVYFPPVEFAYMVSGVTIGQAGTNYTCHFIGGGFDPSGASQPITGQYIGQSQIKLIAGSNTSLVTVHEDAAQPQFKNITFNGNGSQQSGTSYCINMADTTLPSGRYRYACWMEDCFVSAGRTGGIFIGSNRGAGVYRNVWVQYCGTTSSDIAVNVRSFDQQFQNMQIGPNNGLGMYVGSGTQIQLEQSVFFMNKVHLQIDQGAGTVQITDCVFDEAGEDGVIVTRGTGVGAYGARIFTNCAWQRNSKDSNNTYSDIVVNGDRRLVLDSCSFVGDFGQGWLPKYNIECDNTLQSTHIRLTTPVFESNVGATAATAFTNQWFSLAYMGDRTAYMSPWAGTNQLSVVLNDVEEVRFTPSAMSLVGAAYCDPRYTTPAPTTGSTVTMTASQTNCALLPAGSLASLTVALPPPQGDGQIVRISSSEAITTLTVTPQAPATFVFNSTATLAAGDAIAFLYVAGGTSWTRI